MTGKDQTDGSDRIQGFIFARELAEVYLLIDFLSGRSDKSLLAALGGADEKAGKDVLTEICEIAWPPKGNAIERAMQAATLMAVKDRLNTAAKPANGASIAFTLLVSGEDQTPGREPSRFGRMLKWLFPGSKKRHEIEPVTQAPGTGAAASAALVQTSGPQPPLSQATGQSQDGTAGVSGTAANARTNTSPGGAGVSNGGGGSGTPDLAWGTNPPTRFSLAMLAYPNLASRAAGFNLFLSWFLGLLAIVLAITSLLSWHVAKGQEIVSHIETLEKTPPAAAKTPPDPVPPKNDPDQIKKELTAYRESLVEWNATWRGFSRIAEFFGKPQPSGTLTPEEKESDGLKKLQLAGVWLQVLATSILPLCYGLLGAAVAVARNLWTKMKGSLLERRDSFLSWGQLAQGAVIGACIGLFISPSAAGTQNTGFLSGAASLTPSALSFIAGFGVESVFLALESIIKRVFNVSDQKT
jgi:hypothetical protein